MYVVYAIKLRLWRDSALQITLIGLKTYTAFLQANEDTATVTGAKE